MYSSIVCVQHELVIIFKLNIAAILIFWYPKNNESRQRLIHFRKLYDNEAHLSHKHPYYGEVI